jgi:hypothetical protein
VLTVFYFSDGKEITARFWSGRMRAEGIFEFGLKVLVGSKHSKGGCMLQQDVSSLVEVQGAKEEYGIYLTG